MKLIKTLTAVAVVALSAVAMTSCSAKNYAKDNTVYKIGLSGPLTGDASSYGIAVANSAKMAVDEINAKGGLNGVKFELTALDDALDKVKAGTNFNTLYEAGMQVSLGCVTSGCCIEFGGYAAQKNVFCLTPSATSDSVTETGNNMYQMCFSDSGQGTASADYITKNYPNVKVGIFYDSSDDYSNGIYQTFKAAYKSTTTDAAFTKNTNTDFAGQIQQLKNCDLIFMPIYYSQAALFITQAKDDMGANVVYFGCDGLDGIDTVEGFNPNSYSQEISYLSHFNAAADGVTQEYMTKYKAAYPNAPLNQFGAAAYDCVYAIYNAMVAYGKDIPVTTSASDMCKILTGVFQNGTFAYNNGVTGSGAAIKWNADGTVSKTATKFVVNPDRAAA